MNEQNLEDIGFKKYNDTSDEENPFYYWAYDIKDEPGVATLITQTSDEIDKKDGWEVFCYDIHTDLKFTSIADVITFIAVIEKNIT